MRSSFIAVVLPAMCFLAIGSQTWAAEADSQAASSTSSEAPPAAGSIRIRAQCMGQDEKLYGSPVVEVAENTQEAKVAAAEAACRPILEKAASDWDSACAAYVAQLRPLTDESVALMNSGVRLDDPSFAALKAKREEIYRQFPQCSSGRPVVSP